MAPKDTYSLKLADRAQLDRAKADLAGAQARVAEAKAELADLEALSSIESPVSGRVVSLSAASGDRVARDSPVLIIQPDHNLWLRAIFYDMPTALLTPGRAARFLPANGASELPVRFALGTAELTVGFRAGTDPQVDLQAAYGAVDRARGSLPPGISPYAEIMGSAINEVADYSMLIPAGVSPAVVQRAIRTGVLPALRALPGVQRIELFGSGDESLWAQPDLLALRRHGVGVDTLSKTLADQVVMAPTGRLSLGYQDVPIEVRSLPLTTEEIRRLPVPTPDGSVPLEALARVIRAPEPIHYGLDLDGEPSLALIVFKQPGASTVPVTRAVAETLEALQGELPASVRWQLVYDQGYLVSLLRSDLGRNLVVGGVLAVAVLFWLLGAQPGVWMLALSIPLALLFAIAGLYALGHTLNLLTLGALTVAVGLLADDGIIVLEAILHRWETGRPTRSAPSPASCRSSSSRA
jgi:cobalt-zinc-cadmium resistance protein CzcA